MKIKLSLATIESDGLHPVQEVGIYPISEQFTDAELDSLYQIARDLKKELNREDCVIHGEFLDKHVVTY